MVDKVYNNKINKRVDVLDNINTAIYLTIEVDFEKRDIGYYAYQTNNLGDYKDVLLDNPENDYQTDDKVKEKLNMRAKLRYMNNRPLSEEYSTITDVRLESNWKRKVKVDVLLTTIYKIHPEVILGNVDDIIKDYKYLKPLVPLIDEIKVQLDNTLRADLERTIEIHQTVKKQCHLLEDILKENIECPEEEEVELGELED